MALAKGQRVADSTGVAGGVVREILDNDTYKVTWDDGNGNDLEIHESGLLPGVPQQLPPPKEYEGLPDNLGRQYSRSRSSHNAAGVGRGFGDQPVQPQVPQVQQPVHNPLLAVGVMPPNGYAQYTTPVPTQVNPLVALGPMSEIKLVAMPVASEDGEDVIITGLADHEGVDLEENEFILTLRIPTAKLLDAVPKPPVSVIDLF